MCGIQAAMIGLQALSGISQMSAIQKQADAQQQQFDLQAQRDEWAAAAENNKQSRIADQHIQRQEALTNKYRIANSQRNTAAGASGLSIGVGSMADLDQASYSALAKDSVRERDNTNFDTWSSYVNQVDYLNDAAYNRYYGQQVQKQAKAKEFATLLNTAGSIYGMTGGSGGSGSTTDSQWTLKNYYKNNNFAKNNYKTGNYSGLGGLYY